MSLSIIKSANHCYVRTPITIYSNPENLQGEFLDDILIRDMISYYVYPHNKQELTHNLIIINDNISITVPRRNQNGFPKFISEQGERKIIIEFR